MKTFDIIAYHKVIGSLLNNEVEKMCFGTTFKNDMLFDIVKLRKDTLTSGENKNVQSL